MGYDHGSIMPGYQLSGSSGMDSRCPSVCKGAEGGVFQPGDLKYDFIKITVFSL